MSASDIIPPDGGEQEHTNLKSNAEKGQKHQHNDGQNEATSPPKTEGRMKNFTFPLIGGDVATLQVPHPMSEENYGVLMAVLSAIKVSLTTKPRASEEKQASG